VKAPQSSPTTYPILFIDSTSLASKLHARQINGYVNRNYRDRESQENTRVIIPVIGCSLAQDQGKQ